VSATRASSTPAPTTQASSRTLPPSSPTPAPLDATPSCLYTAIDDRLVVCPGGYRYVSLFRDPGAVGCPDYWEVDGQRAATMADAITAAGCGATCLYAATQSVSFIDHCGRRNGYIVFTAPSCPDVYEFSSGYYRSVDDWERETSCGG
jgi:hypothetical protein